MFRGSAYSIETDKDINNSDLFQQEIKIGLIGISDVGKSSMLTCIQNQPFDQDISNTKNFQLVVDEQYRDSKSFWDGAGDKITDFIKKGHLDRMDGFLQIFDLAQKQSFHQLQSIHDELKSRFKTLEKPYLSILIGNKADLVGTAQESQITSFLADKFAKQQGLLFLKASSKKNQFVKDSFVQMIKIILKDRKKHTLMERQEENMDHNKSWKCNGCSCTIF